MEPAYKRYKVDPAIPIPKRTLRRHKRAREDAIMLEFGLMPTPNSQCSGTVDADEDKETAFQTSTTTNSEAPSSTCDSEDTTEPLTDQSGDEMETAIDDSHLSVDMDNEHSAVTFSFNDEDEGMALDDTVFEDAQSEVGNRPVQLEQRYGEMRDTLCDCTETTQGETLLAVLSLGLRHSLSYAAMTDILQMINVLYKREVVPSSYYYLLKHAEPSRVHEQMHPICPECANYIGEAATESAMQCDCGHVLQSPLRCKQFVMSLGMKQQIKDLLEKPGISEALNYRFTRVKAGPDTIEDIYDGALYKNLSSDGAVLSCRNNLSFSFNTDGVKVGNSSTQQLWPIYLMINELPPKLRSRHMLLVGLFVGKAKPNMLVMLQPFVKESNQLSREGLDWQRDGMIVNSKVIPLFSVVDTQARYPMLNHKQFSGYSGCTFCDMEGEYIRGSVRYTMLGLESIPTDRTDAIYRDQMLKGYSRRNHPNSRKRHYKGCRGPSVLMNLDYFDLGSGMPPDSMHFLKGVVNQNLDLILATLDDDEIDRISERILGLHPPSVLTRTPRSLKEKEHFKANELRALLVIYGPVVMHGIVETKNLTHFCLLSSAFYLLMQKRITPRQLEYASKLLVMYVTLYEKYYGALNMTYNVHLLLHVVKSVFNLGPVWTHTCYPFEGKNRYLLQMSKSPLELAKGVARRYSIYNNLPRLCDKFNVSDETLNFCNQMFFRPLRWATRSDGVALVGQGKDYQLSDEEVAAVWDGQRKVFMGNVARFQKFIHDGLRFTTVDYKAAFKRDDSGVYVLRGGNNKCKITNVVLDERDSTVIIFAREMLQDTRPIWSLSGCHLKHITKIRCEGRLLALRPSDVGGQCMFMTTDRGMYVTNVPYGCRGD
ncbi:hypothetical protein FOCC_FOCC012492 [Frankliniella occidentalis]|nr:hypothetical protein FOCC_FOCC013062 [Frankliniella occidentalis]KAE8741932.1 hypothetical protein FOCC_FOCC012492 [Frankliniella occidentalis]